MNRNILSKIGIFTVGAAIGSAVTWKLLKTKFKKQNDEEIKSVIESFSEKENKEIVDDNVEANEDESDRKTADTIIDTEGYFLESEKEDSKSKSKPKAKSTKTKTTKTTKSKTTKTKKKEEEVKEEMDASKPYVISPEEFGECDYAIISLTYYTDGTLTNDRDKIIANVDELIGEDSLNHFGEYEEDSVFVRNDELQTDFEILKDYRAFSEIS